MSLYIFWSLSPRPCCFGAGVRMQSDALSVAGTDGLLAAPVYASSGLPRVQSHVWDTEGFTLFFPLSESPTQHISKLSHFSPCLVQPHPVFLCRISTVPTLTQSQSEGNRRHWHWQDVTNQLEPSAFCFQVTNPSISVRAAWSLMAKHRYSAFPSWVSRRLTSVVCLLD